MASTLRDHFATITTPRGSVVTVPFLTEDEAADVAEQYGPPAEPLPRVEVAAGDTTQCSQCDGLGYWYETVEAGTPSGGKICTQKRVNCGACGGTGSVSK